MAEETHDLAYCLQKAEQCFRLADATTDREAAFKLREIGHDFVRQALTLGADPGAVPHHWLPPNSQRL
jgi:hypothetical protein